MYSVVEQLADTENLYLAFNKARRYKRYKRSVLAFSFNLENNILRVQKKFDVTNYKPGNYVCFTINDPKERLVAAPNFDDRIIHHALFKVLDPMFDKMFIYDSYACRVNKGTHFGMHRVKKFLQSARSAYGKSQDIYCLRMDVRKYFPSISWDILIDILERKVEDKGLLSILKTIVTNHTLTNLDRKVFYDTKIINPAERKGIPIGNLTSQLFANIYLNELDQFIKHQLKMKWYARYMDDFLIIHNDKKYLWELKNTIETFLRDELRLQVHPDKIYLDNVKNGVPFVGYRIFYDHVTIKGKTLQRMRRKYRKRLNSERSLHTGEFIRTKASMRGHLAQANTFGLRKQMHLN